MVEKIVSENQSEVLADQAIEVDLSEIAKREEMLNLCGTGCDGEIY